MRYLDHLRGKPDTTWQEKATPLDLRPAPLVERREKGRGVRGKVPTWLQVK